MFGQWAQVQLQNTNAKLNETFINSKFYITIYRVLWPN